MPNLVSITRPSLQILGKPTSDGGISDIQISGQSLIKENCHNSRTSDDIDMKVGSVTKFDKRNKTASKNSDNEQKIQQSGGRIPDTESVKVVLSVIVTFCLTKTENRTKKYLTQLSHYCFE